MQQDLCSDAVGAQIEPSALGGLRRPRRAVKLRQQLFTALAPVEQDDHAASLMLNVLQGSVQTPRVHVATHLQCVQHRERFMHPRANDIARFPAAHHQSQVHALTGGIAKRVGREWSVGGLQAAGPQLFQQRRFAAAVFNQRGNRANLQPMAGGKNLQIRQPGHGAVVVHDFADHRSGRATRHRRQITARFGMAGAHQHATIHCLQGKNMAGLHQIGGHRFRGDSRLHGARPVGGADAGAHALCGFDGYGERSAVFGAVASGHGRQRQPLAAFAGEGQTNQPAPEARHEIDRLSTDMVRRQDQIAFVFAVFLVHQNHHAPGAQFGNDIGYG